MSHIVCADCGHVHKCGNNVTYYYPTPPYQPYPYLYYPVPQYPNYVVYGASAGSVVTTGLAQNGTVNINTETNSTNISQFENKDPE